MPEPGDPGHPRSGHRPAQNLVIDPRRPAVGHNPPMPISIAVVGDRDPSYLTHRELDAALALMPPGVDARWVATDGPEASRLDRFDALWVVPGTPYRDERPVFAGIERARTQACPSWERAAGSSTWWSSTPATPPGIPEAAHAETAPDAGVHAVSPLACSLEGEVAAGDDGARDARRRAVRPGPFAGFHWCNYGLEPALLDRLVAAGLVVSATAPDAGVEAVELPDHPFYVATLFQPQVGSSETGALHPLIAALVDAAAGVRSLKSEPRGLHRRRSSRGDARRHPHPRRRRLERRGALCEPALARRDAARRRRAPDSRPCSAAPSWWSRSCSPSRPEAAARRAWSTSACSSLAFAALANVEFEIGTGAAIPTQLVFVPMLFLLPLGWVPLAVAAASWCRYADVVRGRRHRERVLRCSGSCWYVIAPGARAARLRRRRAQWDHWPVYVAALAAQFGADLASTRCASGGPSASSPRRLLPAAGYAYGVDSALAPLGLLAAFASTRMHYAFVLVLPVGDRPHGLRRRARPPHHQEIEL